MLVRDVDNRASWFTDGHIHVAEAADPVVTDTDRPPATLTSF
jgi:hypothetical protein